MRPAHERRRYWLLAAAMPLLLAVAGCQRIRALVRGDQCVLSNRTIGAHMAVRVAVEGGGVSGDACCLRCALSYAIQNHRTVRILSVTDYETGSRLPPRDAVYVVNSDVRPCSKPVVAASGNRGECLVLSWDRCDPSILAFASGAEAERFRGEHGGQIEAFQQIARSAPQGSIKAD